MKKAYDSPEFEFHSLRFKDLMSNGEVVISDPQIGDDGYAPGELDYTDLYRQCQKRCLYILKW